MSLIIELNKKHGFIIYRIENYWNFAYTKTDIPSSTCGPKLSGAAHASQLHFWTHGSYSHSCCCSILQARRLKESHTLFWISSLASCSVFWNSFGVSFHGKSYTIVFLPSSICIQKPPYPQKQKPPQPQRLRTWGMLSPFDKLQLRPKKHIFKKSRIN